MEERKSDMCSGVSSSEFSRMSVSQRDWDSSIVSRERGSVSVRIAFSFFAPPPLSPSSSDPRAPASSSGSPGTSAAASLSASELSTSGRPPSLFVFVMDGFSLK